MIKPNCPPTLEEIRTNHPNITVGELAGRLYGHLTYDTALPQHWVDACLIHEYDPRGNFVWVYPEGSIMGQPAPLYAEAAKEIPAHMI